MSQIKDLKNSKENSVNVVDFIELIVPEVKTKYYDLFLRILKGSVEKKYTDKIAEAKNALKTIFPDKAEEIGEYSTINIILISYLFDVLHDTNINIESLKKFVEYNEKNLIERNDITTYKTYDEIHNQVIFTEMKNEEKTLERQVVKLFEDEDWIMLKPLTFESSLKYGYNTKWCTAMETDRSYFNRYAKEGILIYFLNKTTGVKVAVYKKLFSGDNPENTVNITFWNEIDKQIDSFSSNLPGYLLDQLRDHFAVHNVTNTQVLNLLEKNDKKSGGKVEFKSAKEIQKEVSGNSIGMSSGCFGNDVPADDGEEMMEVVFVADDDPQQNSGIQSFGQNLRNAISNNSAMSESSGVSEAPRGDRPNR